MIYCTLKYSLSYPLLDLGLKLRAAFSASRAQHVSDLHSKFTPEMWANAQRDGRPAECMWRPLFNAAKFG